MLLISGTDKARITLHVRKKLHIIDEICSDYFKRL